MRFLILLLAASLTAATPGENDWREPMKPFHVVGNVYFVGTAGLGAYLITTPQGHIVLDGGTPDDAPLIEKSIAALGFKLSDVKYLLNSHAHFDHCGGLGALKKASGARMVASRADAQILQAGHHGSYGAGWADDFPPVHVDRIVNDGDHVQLDGTTLIAVLTPGHTKGCTTWTMQTNEAGKTYNVVFYCSTSVPGYPLVNNREYPNIVSDYEHSFEKLKKLRCDVFLANHTGFFDMRQKLARVHPGAPNPFVDPTELQRFVTAS